MQYLLIECEARALPLSVLAQVRADAPRAVLDTAGRLSRRVAVVGGGSAGIVATRSRTPEQTRHGRNAERCVAQNSVPLNTLLI